MLSLEARAKALFVFGIAVVMFLLASLPGCATFSAETGGQRWYAAKSEYAIYLHLALQYANTPTAEPSIVHTFALIDSEVQALVADVDRALQGTDQESRDKVQASTELLLVLTLRLREALIANGLLEGTSASLRFAP